MGHSINGWAELQVFVAFSFECPAALCVPAGWMVVPKPAEGGDDRLFLQSAFYLEDFFWLLTSKVNGL